MSRLLLVLAGALSSSGRTAAQTLLLVSNNTLNASSEGSVNVGCNSDPKLVNGLVKTLTQERYQRYP